MSIQSQAPIRWLRCACCAGDAGRWHQPSNQDDGFGMCVRCITYVRRKGDSEDDIRMRYGVEGVNWGMSIVVYGLSFRVVAAFPEHEVNHANEWMLAHPTHGLIATHEGLLLLADINDQGAKPAASTPAGRPAQIGNTRVFPRAMADQMNKENN